ncbi:equistatin-like [Salvelinus fontinalis]|uniref:equistatin-like n=1 Tax=Salvelinus fontinalis TaxID=8038 RepID=UPI002484FD2B|nr:equistatin-like [Salvelinus fontinalis]
MLCPYYNVCSLYPDATIRPKTPCERARDDVINGLIGAFIPTCDAAGQYTPEQCSGSTGYCWCVNSSGQKIQGTETLPGTARINCATQNATIRPKTPCERARDDVINGLIEAFIPMCDAAGQYTPEQCSGSKGQCWCVNSSGRKIPGTETRPGTARIKCATKYGTIRPKTPCEGARDAATHGLIGAFIPTCDAAGQYTPEQCSGSKGQCWCVNSSGRKIPGTETRPGTARINCSTKCK